MAQWVEPWPRKGKILGLDPQSPHKARKSSVFCKSSDPKVRWEAETRDSKGACEPVCLRM